MLLSRRTQLHLSSVCIVLAIVFYCSLYFIPHSVKALVQKDANSNRKDGPGDQSAHENQRDLTQILHPEDHIHRDFKTIYLHFDVTSGYRYPDGVKKSVYLINGQFPGPTIEARSGDELQIVVVNSVEDGEGIAIHWHGLTMRGGNEMDGTLGLTQCAIGQSESFTYNFKIEESQAGTFWYHAHSEAHRADGLYGALIVHRPTYYVKSEMTLHDYEEEQLLLIGDWYHRSSRETLDYYMDWKNYGNEPAPDSLLINGIGAFNCSMAVPARPLDCENVPSPRLRINARRTRLRVVNTGALTGFTLSVSGYGMNLFQIDGGNNISPPQSAGSIGILYPGERMDVILQPISDHPNSVARITLALDPEDMKFPNLALTRTQHFPIISPLKRRKTLITTKRAAPATKNIDLVNISGAISFDEKIPRLASETFLLYTKIEILAEFSNIPKGFVNRTSWAKPDPKAAPLLALDRAKWQGKPYVPIVPSGENAWIDIVVNNMDDKGHPFHLHGFDFYVLSTHKARFGSYEAYNPFDTTAAPAGGPLNTRDPPRKDTVFVPRMGYVVLRFKADNEGLWFFHCHVLWHEAVGMGMAFQVGLDDDALGVRERRLKASELCRV